jgi:hypothetical protein
MTAVLVINNNNNNNANIIIIIIIIYVLLVDHSYKHFLVADDDHGYNKSYNKNKAMLNNAVTC